MDRQKCVELLNRSIKRVSVDDGKALLEEYFKNKDIKNIDVVINNILINPELAYNGIMCAIEELCRIFSINDVKQNNQTILFY